MAFPNGVLSFADTFVTMQEERHRADYDPEARFARPDVLVLIDNGEQAIRDLLAAPALTAKLSRSGFSFRKSERSGFWTSDLEARGDVLRICPLPFAGKSVRWHSP